MILACPETRIDLPRQAGTLADGLLASPGRIATTLPRYGVVGPYLSICRAAFIDTGPRPFSEAVPTTDLRSVPRGERYGEIIMQPGLITEEVYPRSEMASPQFVRFHPKNT